MTGSEPLDGTFDGVAKGAMVEDSAGDEYVINYADNSGDGVMNNDLSLTFVPEPGTWAMVGLAALAAGMARGRLKGRAGE